MHQYRLFIHGLLVMGLVIGLGLTAIAHDDDDPPSSEQIAFAQRTSDLLLSTVVAALFHEFDEISAENVAEGSQTIELIFHNHNWDIRLVGTMGPLGGHNNFPRDRFEQDALALALSGQAYTNVEPVKDTWYYRRSFPLNNNLHAACVLCHTNFLPMQQDQWVGALMLRVPINSNDRDD